MTYSTKTPDHKLGTVPHGGDHGPHSARRPRAGGAPAGRRGDVIDFGEAHRRREARLRRDRYSHQPEEPYESDHSHRARVAGHAPGAGRDRARSYRRHVHTPPIREEAGLEAQPEEAASDLRDRRRAQHIERYEKKQQRREKRRQALEAKRARRPACHWGLMALATLLAVLSIPVVYSASTPVALASSRPADYFFLRQVIFVGAGYAFFLALSQMNARQMRVVVWGLYTVALIGLVAIDFTPLGYTQSGVRRWIKLPGLPPQQFSEFAKIALIGVMADFWSRAAVTSRHRNWPWFAAAALSLPLVGLVLVQPHLSAALLLFCVPLFMAVYAGVPFRQIMKVATPLAIAAVVVIGLCKTHSMPFMKEYQQERIAAFIGGGSDDQGSNYQKLQSMRTIMSGGLFGRGPAESLGKQGHLPEPHTDFIFAVIAEEWGLAGTLLLLLAYTTMIFFCFHIGHCAETAFESLVCAGVGTLLAIQVTCNIGVATGVLPVTGMPLPFMSYGGSGLLCVLMGIGMVLSVSRQTSRAAQAAQRAEEERAAGEELNFENRIAVNAREEMDLYGPTRPPYRSGPSRGGPSRGGAMA